MFESTNLIISAGLAVFIFGSYFWCRHLVKIKDRAYSHVAMIDVAIQKRHTLGPEIIQLVDKFMMDQRELLSDAIALFLEPAPAPYVNDVTGLRRYILHAENLGEIMHFMLALAPQYDAYVEQHRLHELMEEYYANEQALGEARKSYNKSVAEVRVGISLFPASLYAHMIGVKALPEFKDKEARDMRGMPKKALEAV